MSDNGSQMARMKEMAKRQPPYWWPPLTFTAFYGYPPSNPKCVGDCPNEWTNRSRELEIQLCFEPEGFEVHPNIFGVADIGLVYDRVLIVTWLDMITGEDGTACLRDGDFFTPPDGTAIYMEVYNLCRYMDDPPPFY